MLKRIALLLLIVWLPSGCAAARDEKSSAARAAQTTFCWPLQTFRYSRSTGGGWLAPRGRGSYHLGVDMFAPVGTPVRAIADGVVYDISTGGWGRGNVALMVKHWLADGRWFIALYGHIRNSKGLRKGSRVRAYSTLGVLGTYYRGSHLHFGVMAPGRYPHAPYGTSKRSDHNNFIDPLQFLRSGHPSGSLAASSAQHSVASVKTVVQAAAGSEKKVGNMAEAEYLAEDEFISVSPAEKQQSRKQVRDIRSKNKKRSAKKGRKSRRKKQVVKQKSKHRRSSSKVRSLTGSSKRAVSARGRR